MNAIRKYVAQEDMKKERSKKTRVSIDLDINRQTHRCLLIMSHIFVLRESVYANNATQRM